MLCQWASERVCFFSSLLNIYYYYYILLLLFSFSFSYFTFSLGSFSASSLSHSITLIVQYGWLQLLFLLLLLFSISICRCCCCCVCYFIFDLECVTIVYRHFGCRPNTQRTHNGRWWSVIFHSTHDNCSVRALARSHPHSHLRSLIRLVRGYIVLFCACACVCVCIDIVAFWGLSDDFEINYSMSKR